MDDLMMDKALGVQNGDDSTLSGAVSDIESGKAIGKKELSKAVETLKKYKDGKTNLENLIVENEQWYKLRHWDVAKKEAGEAQDSSRPEPTSAWLFNSLVNKHADAMDNYPEPNVLPREPGDKKDAETLSSIIPVVLE